MATKGGTQESSRSIYNSRNLDLSPSGSSQSMSHISFDQNKNILQNKLLIAVSALMSVFYFVDVVAGMLVIFRNYDT